MHGWIAAWTMSRKSNTVVTSRVKYSNEKPKRKEVQPKKSQVNGKWYCRIKHFSELFSRVMVDTQNIDLWQHNVCKENKQGFYVKAQLEVIFPDHCPATCFTEHVYTTSDSGGLTYLIWVRT